MITGIACMQLVEQGILALDDVELVERLRPVSRLTILLKAPFRILLTPLIYVL